MPNQAEQEAAQNVAFDRVGEVHRRAIQHRKILSNGHARKTDGALERLGTSDTTKHVLKAKGSDQWEPVCSDQTAHKQLFTVRWETGGARCATRRVLPALTRKWEGGNERCGESCVRHKTQ